ncbi:MAG TPA: 6-bladed beta-propeller [Chthoniobacterales bacterium]|nr:6-bladed beta-propeller [Chthoniobacterales bacterium]
MLALLYLALAFYLGDQVCRRFLRFLSVAHRCAAAILVGLLLSSWFTYLCSWLFQRTARPILWGDLCYLGAAIISIWAMRRHWRPVRFIRPRAPGTPLWDWVFLAAYIVLVSWLMFATYDYKNGTLLIGNNEWSDFGPNTAIVQSFAVGHNFPTQYPHFSGETIRYHFLFYFQAGNLTFLGLGLAWSLNLLSILTLVSMLAMVMTFGQLLFNSRTVGRLGSALFFFHGTLSFVSFLRSQASVANAWRAILGLKDFLPSGYPYRGELWGIWTQVVFLNQRHFASAVGLLLLVLIFLVDRYRVRRVAAEVANDPVPDPSPPLPVASASDLVDTPADPQFAIEPQVPLPEAPPPKPRIPLRQRMGSLLRRVVIFDSGYLFCGFVLGLLPFWNALVFTAAFALLTCFFVFFSGRRQLVTLGLTTAIVALPQLIILKSGGVQSATHSILHWGYIVEPPTLDRIVRYIGFSFGLKLSLILIALAFLSWFHHRFFLALCSMFAVTFCFQLSLENLANHKYLNIWLIIGNLFVAYGAWKLWTLRRIWLQIFTRPLAFLLIGAVMVGGAIDLFPIHNSYFIELKYGGDRLVQWLWSNTKPHDVFLSDRFVNHQILLAGRRLFYGWPSFSWGAGYDTTLRDDVYRQLFESTDPVKVFQLLRKWRINWVAIDDGVRRGEFIKRHNEELYSLNFEKVWEDKPRQYNGLVIYKVPEQHPKEFKRPDPARLRAQLLAIPPVTMFQGGKGLGRGQLDFPRGMTLDRSGNILVADTNNGRIQRFSPAGAFLNMFGAAGHNPGEFQEPNGLAVDLAGNIYVADVANQRVQKLTADGQFLAQWRGPDPGFYGPRDIWVTSDNFVYVVDQGRARIAKLTANGAVAAVWGTAGSGDGQFDDPTAVTVDEKNKRVYVADPRNRRIQVFDTDGKFITKWAVKEWAPTSWSFHDIVVDQATSRLYATSPVTDEVLVYDLEGTRITQIQADPPNKFEGASGIVVSNGKLFVLCTFADRVRQVDLNGR